MSHLFRFVLQNFTPITACLSSVCLLFWVGFWFLFANGAASHVQIKSLPYTISLIFANCTRMMVAAREAVSGKRSVYTVPLL